MRTPVRSRRHRTMAVAVVVALLVAVVPRPASASDDARFPEQWALARIRAEAAWASSTGAGVRIGIVDTGVDLEHEDLADRVVAHTSCIGSGGDPSACRGSGQDDHGHGTHVAGIAAATRDNGVGIAGVAPDAELVVAKALDATGAGSTQDINAAIKWVVDHGARVVNLSLGGNFLITSLLGTDMAEGIVYAWSKGAVPVLASGNSHLLGFGLGSSNYGTLPAVVVGAVGPDDRLTSYSASTGNARWAVVAPGGSGGNDSADDILSTYWDGSGDAYAHLAGTSMATPHVAGVLALLLAMGSTPAEAVARVILTADPAVPCGGSSLGCHGRLDAAAAVEAARTGSSGAPPTGGGGLLGIDLTGLPLVGELLGGLL